MDLAKLELDDFSARTGEEFLIATEDGGTMSLVLSTATKRPEAGRSARPDNAFSVLFRGPLDFPLEQQIYELQHAEMGTLPLFIVPVQQDDSGIYYEAVFTRLTS